MSVIHLICCNTLGTVLRGVIAQAALLMHHFLDMLPRHHCSMIAWPPEAHANNANTKKKINTAKQHGDLLQVVRGMILADYIPK